MSRSFPSFDLGTAPRAAQPILAETQRKFGMLPSPVARLAAAPAVLQAALAGLEVFEHSSLAPLEREVLAMTLARHNGCHYCITLHRRLLRLADAPPALAHALEHGEPLEPRLEALRAFILSALEHTGDVSEPAWTAFLAAGFDRVAALEVVQGIAAYTLTTFANRLTEAPLD